MGGLPLPPSKQTLALQGALVQAGALQAPPEPGWACPEGPKQQAGARPGGHRLASAPSVAQAGALRETEAGLPAKAPD